MSVTTDPPDLRGGIHSCYSCDPYPSITHAIIEAQRRTKESPVAIRLSPWAFGIAYDALLVQVVKCARCLEEILKILNGELRWMGVPLVPAPDVGSMQYVVDLVGGESFTVGVA